MKLYIYAKSGHNFGLENIRRCSAVFNMLKECDPILCSADYRAATFAKEFLAVTKGVGIDVIGNLPNLMERGDMLIYDDSGEASDTMKTHMGDFCQKLFKIGSIIPFDIVDPIYTIQDKTIDQKAVFFSDDDYDNWFYELVQKGSNHDMLLVLGHYFFFGNDKKLKNHFSKLREEDDYIDTIKYTKHLLTSSVHSCLESIGCGNKPVYFKRKDKINLENLDLLEKYNIPIIDIDDPKSFDDIVERFEQIIANYPAIKPLERFDITAIKDEINKVLELFAHICPSLEYK